MTWWKRDKPSLGPTDETDRHVKTEGLWTKCDSCGQIIWRKALEEGMQVCPQCGFHFRIDAQTRLRLLFDEQWEEFDERMLSSDPLQFLDSKSYTERLAAMRESTSMCDAVVSASGLVNGRRVNVCAFELTFIGGSMGAVVGEKITR